jgi:hypothetical protein
MDVYQETIADWPRYEEERVFNLVVAKTRGKARALFTSHNDLDFIDPDVSIRKVMTGVAIDEQFSYRAFSYRTKDYDQMLQPYEDTCWSIICRKNLICDDENITAPDDPTICPYYQLCSEHSKCRYERKNITS